jgi:hypothetical protein
MLERIIQCLFDIKISASTCVQLFHMLKRYNPQWNIASINAWISPIASILLERSSLSTFMHITVWHGKRKAS